MMIMAIITGVLACIIPVVEGAVILSVTSFIFWYAGIMAPKHEKYTTRTRSSFMYHGSDKDGMHIRNIFTPQSDIDKLKKHMELTHEFCDNMQEAYMVLVNLRTRYIQQEKYHLVNVIQDELDRMLAEVDSQAVEYWYQN